MRTEIFSCLCIVLANSNWCIDSNVSAVHGILVGATRTITNCFLEYVGGMYAVDGDRRDLLHPMEKCQTVILFTLNQFTIRSLH